MVNIIIVGFETSEADKLRDQIDIVIKRIRKESDSITTILPYAHTKRCNSNSHVPYLIVRHIDKTRAKVIASALHLSLNLNIEVEVIYGFLEKVV